MDTLNDIKQLMKSLKEVDKSTLNNGVIIHIERAEYHYSSGKKNKDLQCFTDSVYRCNQAYEGILRDAYLILAKNESVNITTYEIEEYFEAENILNPRVRNAFSNYRKEWRNPSTHNHKLFFDEEETYMAILSVESFIYVLLRQILESEVYRTTKTALLQLNKIVEKLKPYDTVSVENIINVLLKFNKYVIDDRIGIDAGGLLVIAIRSYLEIMFPMIDIVTYLEKEISYKLFSDITIKYNNTIVCEIDVKAQFDILFSSSGNDRLKEYLSTKKGMVGIQYYYSKSIDDEYTVWQRSDVKKNNIYVIYPKNKDDKIRLTTAST